VTGVLERLAGLARALREAGVVVGPAALVDAAEALGVLGLEDRERVRAALAATMVKDHESRPLFDALFDLYFGLAPRREPGIEDEALHEALREALLGGDEDRLRQLAGEAVERFAGLSPGRPVAGVYYRYRTTRALELDRLTDELLAGLRTRPGDEGDSIFGDASARARALVAGLVDEIDSAVRARMVADRGADAVARSLGLKLPEDTEIMHASREELAELERVIAPLATKLAAKLQRRHRSKRPGRLDVRRTIRASLSTGGVPLVPVTERARPMRPEVFLLADVSGSVAAFARFTLQLVWALSRELRRLRSFAFIDEVDEVTEHLAGGVDIEAALRQLASEARVVGRAGHSDYGQTFASFLDRFGESVSGQTTVIVLGDARSNYHDPAVSAFRELAVRARALYWLNPEPRSYWATGDSAMASYAPWCRAVVECRTPRQLERFIAEVL
jgi:uncharacterized protein with von Willebrand factor type A (vWA) domain